MTRISMSLPTSSCRLVAIAERQRACRASDLAILAAPVVAFLFALAIL